MKRLATLFMALLVVVSMMSTSAFAAADDVSSTKITETTSEVQLMDSQVSLASDERSLKVFDGERIYLSKTYSVTPNKGWNLWLILAPIDYGCTITVKQGSTVIGTYSLAAGEKINQKVITSCSGATCYITITAASGAAYTTIAGGINQTEYA